jgi:hypothetical protein
VNTMPQPLYPRETSTHCIRDWVGPRPSLDDCRKPCSPLGFDGWTVQPLQTMLSQPTGPTQPPLQWLAGIPSPAVKRMGHEFDQSPPSSTKVKNEYSCTSSPSMYLHGVHRGSFTIFTFSCQSPVSCISSSPSVSYLGVSPQGRKPQEKWRGNTR